MEKTADVIIIGGGIIGTSIAAFLSEKMKGTIVLLEKGLLGEGSTSRCAGGIRCQFTTPINIEFSLQSLKIFENFEELFGVDPEFHPSGYLFLASTDEEFEGLKAGVKLQRSYGIDVDVLSPEEIKTRWPYLNIDGLVGGTFGGQDGYAGPYEVLQGYVKKARARGVKIPRNARLPKSSPGEERSWALKRFTVTRSQAHWSSMRRDPTRESWRRWRASRSPSSPSSANSSPRRLSKSSRRKSP